MLFAPTIGIITVRPEELSTVAALIDNSSWDLRVDGGGPSYLAGTMPSAQPGVAHDVVVGLGWRTGAVDDAVATATRELMRTFPTVGVIVSCGIAAGAPGRDPHQHVAVGDIVVARHGFVFEDDVRVTDDGVGVRPRIADASPLLAAAADELRTARLHGSRPWEAWLEPAVCGLPVGFRRPEEPQCPPETRRRHGTPNVHYGRVGGAVGSLRSSWVLEALADRHALRAVELAGRGMRTGAFPRAVEWFVVRGIAEDATIVTEHDWRPAAALAAAAYTRALLGACLPVRPRSLTPRPRLHIPRLRERRSGRLGRRLQGLHRPS